MDRRFGVLYLGSSLKVCFLETILRDERDGIVGQVEIAESDLYDRRYAEIRVREGLQLLDLTGDGPVRMGNPSDIARSSRQALSRRWSVAFHEHPRDVDGIVYPSRLNGETNPAIYGRAVGKLELLREHDLKHAPGLAEVLDEFLVVLLWRGHRHEHARVRVSDSPAIEPHDGAARTMENLKTCCL